MNKNKKQFDCYYNPTSSCLIFIRRGTQEDLDSKSGLDYIGTGEEGFEFAKMLHPQVIPLLKVWENLPNRLQGDRYLIDKHLKCLRWYSSLGDWGVLD